MRTQNSRKLREQLVEELERGDLIRSAPVREAFLAVPRELFVPEFAVRNGLAAVYRNEAIVTKHSQHGVPLSSSSQPSVMAAMLEHLELREGMRVLEVGAGTGYNAALLSVLVGRKGRVVSVDVDPQVAAQARRALRARYPVRVVHADGRAGYSTAAPYDRIIVTASSDTIPHAWFEQLIDGGLLELPLRLDTVGTQFISVLRKTGRAFRSTGAVCGGFMPLRARGDDGEIPPREPSLSVSDTTREAPEPVLWLSGAALATLSGRAKRRLVATALGTPRRTSLGLRANHDALALYLSLTLPKGRRVASFPTFCVGVIGRDGRSLALIDSRPGRREIGFMRAYGNSEAEAFLLARVRVWARRGCPSASDLRVDVVYEAERPELTVRWPGRVSEEARG